MPRSALPEHINDPDEIENAFPDDSQYGDGWFGRLYKWMHKETKTWFAFSYRCTEWWARWRNYPKVLFAIGGSGSWRYEGDHEWYSSWLYKNLKEGYLSRVQYYKRWHLAIQWPLMISFHWYPKASDIPIPLQPRPDLKGKVWYGYWNHFDADLVYWMLFSVFFGKTWK